MTGYYQCSFKLLKMVQNDVMIYINYCELPNDMWNLDSFISVNLYIFANAAKTSKTSKLRSDWDHYFIEYSKFCILEH